VNRAAALEAFLAQLLVDADLRARFAVASASEAARAGLDPAACDEVAGLDLVGLELAAASFTRKRATARRHSAQRIGPWWPRLWRPWLGPR
jgi:hypothetical protein